MRIQLAALDRYLAQLEPVGVTPRILTLAARLWADGRSAGMILDDCDLFIAATALSLGATLVTSNSKHFAWIADLRAR
ncbi:MAG: hypothetical protein QM811_28245 [Pirellulales bacterium]